MRAYDQLRPYMEKAMAIKTALTLFEWDNETLAPDEAGELTASVIGVLSGEYLEAAAGKDVEQLLAQCEEEDREDGSLAETERAVIREMREELQRVRDIPKEEYQEFARLTARSAAVWVKARREHDFGAFAPVLESIIRYQKRFAGYRAKEGEALYDVMLEDYEKGFTMENLDQFFGIIKAELVPFLRKIREEGRRIDDSFLAGDYPNDRQEKLARFLAEYVGFDFKRGVLAVSAHPFTTNLHNKDVRITTHYSRRVDSSLFSVIHEAGHGIYEMGIRNDLTLTPVGQGASMGMHESQSRFFENIIGRSRYFWIPIYEKLRGLFPDELGEIPLETFVDAVNKVQPGLIRTEADELTYSLHVLIRYEIEKLLIEEDMDVREIPRVWADKYEEYLGVRPEHSGEGELQDIHWSQGSFGYFPSYALGSAFGAQIYYHMREIMDFDGLLARGEVGAIREYLRENIHQYGRLKTSRQILRDMTGEDFDPAYYIRYLKEKYGKIYRVKN